MLFVLVCQALFVRLGVYGRSTRVIKERFLEPSSIVAFDAAHISLLSKALV